jgi:hypothetical protein
MSPGEGSGPAESEASSRSHRPEHALEQPPEPLPRHPPIDASDDVPDAAPDGVREPRPDGGPQRSPDPLAADATAPADTGGEPSGLELLARGRRLLGVVRDLPGRPPTDERTDLARGAAARLATGIAQLRTAQPRSIELCAARLDLAEAQALADTRADRARIEAVLTEALRIARDLGDTVAQAECLRRIAREHRTTYARGGEARYLFRADRALAAAQALLPTDHPDLPALLTDRGDIWLECDALRFATAAAREPAVTSGPAATHEPGAAPATSPAPASASPVAGRAVVRAVRLLRAAVAGSPSADPGAPYRRLLLGRALRLRYVRLGALADLHESAWYLAVAARGATDPDTAARAWLEEGYAQELLGRRTGVRTHRECAADAYRHSSAAATRSGDPLLAARAHQERAQVLEVIAGPSSALEAYRDAWVQWQRAGLVDSPESLRTRERMWALDAPRREAAAGGWDVPGRRDALGRTETFGRTDVAGRPDATGRVQQARAADTGPAV